MMQPKQEQSLFSLVTVQRKQEETEIKQEQAAGPTLDAKRPRVEPKSIYLLIFVFLYNWKGLKAKILSTRSVRNIS